MGTLIPRFCTKGVRPKTAPLEKKIREVEGDGERDERQKTENNRLQVKQNKSDTPSKTKVFSGMAIWSGRCA